MKFQLESLMRELSFRSAGDDDSVRLEQFGERTCLEADSFLEYPLGSDWLFRCVTEEEAALNPFRFSSEYADETLGLAYYNYRHYDPCVGRWLNRDPIGEDGGVNLYAFCDNDPVNTFDPNGCIPLDTVWDLANVIYDICVGDYVALAADTSALVVPYVPAGATKLVKAARLSKVEKICPGMKNLEVTYEYLPTAQYGYKHTLNHMSGKSWIEGTNRGRRFAKLKPGWGDAEIKELIEEAFTQSQAQGKVKPSQLDGFIYDTGRIIGARARVSSATPGGSALSGWPVERASAGG